ncbi:MAG TPA: hypothetical protein VFL13_10530 [Candidatus Baltobacteraceae bacterium]|nr:hypothetical protein [Candidatus Baltobacteraceae bacterium]
MIDIILIAMILAVIAMGVYGVRYYWQIGNSPTPRTTMGSEPTDPVETILRGDFAAQTPELEAPLAVQKAFGIVLLVAVVLMVLISSLVKLHAH